MAEKRKRGLTDENKPQEIASQEAQATPAKENVRKGKSKKSEGGPVSERGGNGTRATRVSRRPSTRTAPTAADGGAEVGKKTSAKGGTKSVNAVGGKRTPSVRKTADATAAMRTTGMAAGPETAEDVALFAAIRAVIMSPEDSTRDMHALCDAIYRSYGTDPSRGMTGATSQRDEEDTLRAAHEIWAASTGSTLSRKRATLAGAMLFTSSSGPMRSEVREPLENAWLRGGNGSSRGNGTTSGGIVSMYRDLIRLRRSTANSTRGLRGRHVNIHHINDSDKVIAFHRWDAGGIGDDVIVVVNAANRGYGSYTIGFPRGGAWKVRFNSDWQGYSPDFGNHFSYDTMAMSGPKDGLGYHGNVGIGPYSVIILSQDG